MKHKTFTILWLLLEYICRFYHGKTPDEQYSSKIDKKPQKKLWLSWFYLEHHTRVESEAGPHLRRQMVQSPEFNKGAQEDPIESPILVSDRRSLPLALGWA